MKMVDKWACKLRTPNSTVINNNWNDIHLANIIFESSKIFSILEFSFSFEIHIDLGIKEPTVEMRLVVLTSIYFQEKW